VEKLLGMLGLARRAGKVVIGTEQICVSLSKRQAKLLIISNEASDNAKKKLVCKAEFYGVKVIIINVEMTELGRLLGKSYAPAAVAVTDEGFALRLGELAEEVK